jgi:ribonuclease R
VKVIKVDVLRNQIDLEVASEPVDEPPSELEPLVPVTLSET